MNRRDALPARRPLATGVASLTVLLFVLAWLAIVGVAPASAAPLWTIGSETPMDGQIIDAPNTFIQADVTEVAPRTINPALSQMTIDGLPVTPTTDINAGVATVGYYRTGLAAGPHLVSVTAYNDLGESAAYSWLFYYDPPPVINWFTPATNTYFTTGPPYAFEVSVSDIDEMGNPVPFASLLRPRLQIDSYASVLMVADAPTSTFRYTRAAAILSSDSWIPVNLDVTDGNTLVVAPRPSWRIFVNTQPDVTPPTLTNPNPVPGSTTNARPVFSIEATDNRPTNLTVSFVLDGSTVFSQSVPQGTATWGPNYNLANGPHTVTAAAVDAVGNSAAPQTWSFTVASAPAVPSHATTTPFTTCSSCHNPDLRAEHANRGYGCGTGGDESCHADTKPSDITQEMWDLTQNAIEDGNTNCDACHDVGGAHMALHDGGLPSGGGCSECHESNTSAEHGNDCDACHESTNERVSAAIAGSDVECGACHEPGIHPPGFFRYRQDYYNWTTTPGPWGRGTPLGEVGSNPDNPGAHANYLATTAKCGMCHSVHRAAGNGVKLLPTADATCQGCHTGGTAITAKIVTWAPVDTAWVPEYDTDGTTILNEAAAGGGGGPHNDPVWDTALESGATEYPLPSYDVEPFARYGCFTRRCHATNPHGAGTSKYTIFASKLLFNDSPADDDATNPDLATLHGPGTYGGLDAVYDGLGATDAAVQRFADANSGIITLTDDEILINGDAPDPDETHALVAGLTCGRPSNVPTGEDECHAEAAYAIVDKGIGENRNHATGAQQNPYATDNTGEEEPGMGGNDNRDWKTGHVAGTFAAGDSEYAPIAGCTSCHDQTDSANTVAGNFTFPHGQTATGDTNIYRPDGATMATGDRVRIWAGYAGSLEDTLTNFESNYSNQKAFDGQCLKCHRSGTQGVGLTY